jgi:N-acetylglucosamine-6-sulfatase
VKPPRLVVLGIGPAVALLLLAALVTRVALHREEGTPPSPPPPPNIVFILTDDQRFDQLDHMRTVQSSLIGKGVSFSRAFVSNSQCCPSRSTLLTGQYSHSTGVYTNSQPDGGFGAFRDHRTIPTVLHAAGYRTALIGKYLNGYVRANVGYIPPGWDRWFAIAPGGHPHTAFSDQGRPVPLKAGENETDVFGREAVRFIRTTPARQPLFLWLAFHAPHKPANPSPQYAGTLAGLPPLRPPSYDEPDLSDKPAYMRGQPRLAARRRAAVDAFRQQQYESLLSVDDRVRDVLGALAQTGRLRDTLVVYASDNGLMLGEHRLVDRKIVPYEESIRVPMIVRWDAARWHVPRSDPHLVGNVDVAPTFASAAGLLMPMAEGRSLLPILGGAKVSWRQEFLLEHAEGGGVPAFCGLRTARWVYVEYTTGEEELYDLASDQFELSNRASDESLKAIKNQLGKRVAALCVPTPPGYRPPRS